jgi:hypothetical protein
MKKFFNQLFCDNNSINEKSVVGFASFLIMVVFAISDIVTGTLGKDLIINEFIFNSFLILTLGSFGIVHTKSCAPGAPDQHQHMLA